MKYSELYTTKWHDTDAERKIRTTQILMYLQECANHQCRDYGLDLDAVRDNKGCGFILSRISLHAFSPIRAYESIRVSTWCAETKGYAFTRFFSIEDSQGRLLVSASSTWALVDISTHSLLRSDFLDADFPYDDPPNIDLPPRVRIRPDEVLEERLKRRICYSDIDYNNHMNNTKYADMLLDALFPCEIEGSFVSDLSMSYLHEAAYGKEVTISHQEYRGIHYFRVTDDSGNNCTEAAITLSPL